MTTTLVFDPAKTKQLLSNLERLPRRVHIKHLRIGLNAWGGVVRDEFKSQAAEETGLLKKSAAVKVTIPDASRNSAHHGKPARVLVGADRRVVRAMLRRQGKADKLLTDRKALKHVLSGGKVHVRKPSRYLHLAERKKPAMARAQKVGETRGMAKLAQKLEQGIAAEAAALLK